MFADFKREFSSVLELTNQCPKTLRKECFSILAKHLLGSEAGESDAEKLESIKIPASDTKPKTTLEEPTADITTYKKDTVPHGFIQLFTWVACFALSYLVIVCNSFLAIYDKAYIIFTFVAFSVAVTFSHAYNATPEAYEDKLAREADSFRSRWAHANFCWQIVDIWLTMTPVFCTGVTVYITQENTNLSMIKNRIIVYSVLSLISSFASFSFNPGRRAKGFRDAHRGVRMALSLYSLSPAENRKQLSDAIIDGETALSNSI